MLKSLNYSVKKKNLLLKRGWKRRKNTEEDTLPRLLPRHRAYLIFFSTNAMFCPRLRILAIPSASFRTSPASLP